jgi:hypothetical protein
MFAWNPGAASAACAENGRTSAVSRRAFLRTVTSLAIAPWSTAGAQDRGVPTVGLDEFIRLSRVLTGVGDLSGESEGREYLDALLGRPGGTARLAELWKLGGFEGPEPPETVEDLATRGVYAKSGLSELADTITANWYTGMYLTPDGETRVATYTGALAWRTLGYRPAGPSACGGAFGHWADRPA